MDGKSTGTISLTRPRFATDFPSALSVHDVGLKDMIEAVYMMEEVPDIHLFTVSIKEINPMTIDLSTKVKESVPLIIDKIIALSKELHLKKL
jgi:hydrogenase maturation protease